MRASDTHPPAAGTAGTKKYAPISLPHVHGALLLEGLEAARVRRLVVRRLELGQMRKSLDKLLFLSSCALTIGFLETSSPSTLRHSRPSAFWFARLTWWPPQTPVRSGTSSCRQRRSRRSPCPLGRPYSRVRGFAPFIIRHGVLAARLAGDSALRRVREGAGVRLGGRSASGTWTLYPVKSSHGRYFAGLRTWVGPRRAVPGWVLGTPRYLVLRYFIKASTDFPVPTPEACSHRQRGNASPATCQSTRLLARQSYS